MNFRVLTPVHISSGQVLTKYEFIIKGSKFQFYSFDEIINYIDSKEVAKDLFKFGLENFIKHYQLNIKPTYEIPFHGTLKDKVYEFIKLKNRVYIPGSSIKGAIRTAYLYRMIKNDVNLRNKFLNAIRTRDKYFYRDMEKEIDNVFRKILISDSDLFEPSECLKVVEIKHKNLSLAVEVLRENFEFEIDIKFKDSALKNEIDNAISEFSKDLVNYLKSIGIYNNLADLEKNKKLIRLGKFKGYFSNTIMLVLFYFDKELYQNYRKITFWRTNDNKPLGFCEISFTL
jgi:CRISPR-associated protein Csm5